MAIYTLDEILKSKGATVKDIKPITSSQSKKAGGYSLDETIGDIKQTASNIGQTVKSTFSKAQEAKQSSRSGEQGMLRGFVQQAGIGLGGLSQVAGDVVSGAIKTALPQEGEDAVKGAVASAVKPVAESDFAQNIMSKYAGLDEKQKRDVDAVLGIGSFLADVAGAGVVGKSAKAGVKGVSESVQKVGQAVKSTIDDIPAVNIGGDALKPESIMQRVARVNPTEQSKFKDISGETIGEYLTNRKIFGSQEKIATDLVTRFKESRDMADTALASLKGTFTPRPVKTVLIDLFNKEKSISTPGALSKDFKRVQTLRNKFDKEGLDMSEINEVKRLYERNVKLDFVKQNLPDGVKKANTLDDAVRKWQVQQAEKLGLKNLPDINNETRYAKMLADALGKKLAGSSANNAVSLTDWVALSGGDPSSVAMFVGKKILSSSKLQSKLAEKMTSKRVKKEVKAEFGKSKPDLTDFLTK